MGKGEAAPFATKVDLPALITVTLCTLFPGSTLCKFLSGSTLCTFFGGNRRKIDGSEPEMKNAAFFVSKPTALQHIGERCERCVTLVSKSM